MVSSKFNASILIIFVCALIPLAIIQLGSVNGQTTPITTFTLTPKDYNNQTGSFTLSGQFTYDSTNRRTTVCISYDYFTFNAQAGQTLHGKLMPGDSSRPFYYFILNSYPQFSLFSQYGCSAPNYFEPQTFSSALSWVAPEVGRYVLVLFTPGFYGGLVYFTS